MIMIVSWYLYDNIIKDSLISDAEIGFTSPYFTVRESDGQVNVQVGVLSGSLQKEVMFNFFITDLNAFGNIYPKQSLRLFFIYRNLFCVQLEKIIIYHKFLNLH